MLSDSKELLLGVRYAAKGENSVVLTGGDLLRLELVKIDQDDHFDDDTRVRTEVSWLELAGFLLRNGNYTRVFQGKPVVRNLRRSGRSGSWQWSKDIMKILPENC